MERAVVLLTGIQAAGKSTVAQGLAERLPRSVHVRGDAYRRMVVNGREEMSPEPSEEAVRQLRLRYRLMVSTAGEYFRAGFAVVAQDVVLGPHLAEVVELFDVAPLLVVVLAPSPEAVLAREAGRRKSTYDEWTVGALDRGLRETTPRLGLWLDTSEQTPEQTVTEILDRAWTEGRVR